MHLFKAKCSKSMTIKLSSKDLWSTHGYRSVMVYLQYCVPIMIIFLSHPWTFIICLLMFVNLLCMKLERKEENIVLIYLITHSVYLLLFFPFLLFVILLLLYFILYCIKFILYVRCRIYIYIFFFNSASLSAAFSTQHCNHSGKKEAEIYYLMLTTKWTAWQLIHEHIQFITDIYLYICMCYICVWIINIRVNWVKMSDIAFSVVTRISNSSWLVNSIAQSEAA